MSGKQEIIDRLDKRSFYSSALPSLKVNGSETGQALCPWHEDTNPSLSIDLKTGVFKCFGCSKKGSIFDFYMERHSVDYKTAFNALAQEAGLSIQESPRKIVKTYDYTNEAGVLLFQVVRYEPKTFRQRRPDGKNGWIYNLQGVKLVPYNLPGISKAKSVIIVEGEKDVETLRGMGLVGSCNAQGAGKWRQEYSGYFQGKKIAILPDNDEAGRTHAIQVAQHLKGVTSSLKIVSLPGLPVKGDVSDWIKTGGTKDQLIDAIKNAPEWEQGKEETPGLVRLETVTPEKVEWFWYPYIPLGKITLLDGDPGNGKSLFTTDLIARCTNGGHMPDGTAGVQGGAVLMALEDGLADTIVPRLEVAGGNKSKAVALQGVPDILGNLRFPTIADVEQIANACKEIKAKLVVIDPLMGYLGDANSWKDQDIRRAMAPLVKMAEEQNVAVLVIRHLNKSAASQSMYRGGGSIGFIGLARVGLLIAKDPEDENRRILAGIKSNLAPLPASLSYCIEDHGGIPKIVWGGISNHTADALLSVPTSPEEKTAVDEAKEFLLDILELKAVEANEVIREAKKAAISERTLNRAKKLLGIRSEKSQFGGGWKWTLPGEDCQEMPKVVNKNNGNLGGNLATLGEDEPGHVVDLSGDEIEVIG
ncbi:MAG: AAA family ATPase [Nitrospiraceae bacterium]|nr:AAA family ATPase [Nitrospiraceae bacterium]